MGRKEVMEEKRKKEQLLSTMTTTLKCTIWR
jgi:hypothetical protein